MAQFLTLLNKNFIMWRRDTCCCACQITTVIVFALILAAIKALSASSEVIKESTSYLGNFRTLADVPFPYPTTANVNINSNEDVIKLYSDFANTKIMGKRPYFKDCNILGGTASQMRGGYVALVSPNNQMYDNLVLFFNALNFTSKRFDSVDDFSNIIASDKYGRSNMPNGIPDTVCLGISFQESTGNQWAYSLHFNSSGNPSDRDIPDSVDLQEIPFKEEITGFKTKAADYILSGALVVQGLIDNLILRTASGNSKANIQTRFIKMPIQKYSDNGLYSNTNDGQIDTYVIFPLLVIFLGFIYHMLKEKERKITENMRNMGMSLLPHYLSWMTFYTIVLFSCSIVWSLIVKGTFFRYSNFICIWFLFFLPGLVLLSLAFVVSSFFITAKPGVLAGIITFFILYAFTIGKGSVDPPSESAFNGFAISPFTGLSFAGANMVLLESTNNFGFGFQNVNDLINFFRFRTFIIICIFEAIGFFLLGIYLDQVWPTEIGIKKHPLFFLGIGHRNHKDKDDSKHIKIDEEYARLNYEQVPPEFLQSNNNEILSIKDLRKVYSNGKVGVHNLSLDMFNNQIFALLGHNGAGKTTTISMISGLLTQTSGTISICGYDTRTQYDQVRSILGVCPQLNPIYDNLTCEEHLRLYGTLKLNGKEIGRAHV